MKKEEYNFEQAIDIIKQIVDTKGIKQTELELITGVKQGNISKMFKKELRNKDGSLKFFTVKQLIALSSEWGISIDELLGLTQKAKPVIPTPRTVCYLIANLEKYNMHFAPIKTREDCWYESYDYEYGCCEMEHNQKDNTYNAIYFSEWWPIPNSFTEEYDELTQLGNNCGDSRKINIFLARLKKIQKMKKDGDLDEEMYGRLLESYLKEVPDK